LSLRFGGSLEVLFDGDGAVELQMGGADQWGNITAGLELIRRTAGDGADERPAPGEEER
jgi:hypothetical protein